MSNKSDPEVSRREFLHAAGSGLALVSTPALALAATAAEADKAAVLAQVPKMHAANLKRLQDWIALPSIAAENRNYPQGPDYMAKLAREAGFTSVEIVPTSGKSGVFGRIDAGARTTLGVYFMYDVKQFVPEEWSSPPLEGRLVKKEGVGTVCMGRGAVNQKGPENSFLSALMAFQAAGRKLPVNLLLVCECERSTDTTLGQTFQLISGQEMTKMVAEPGNRLGQLIEAGKNDEQIVDELYWATLTRAPSDAEMKALVGHVKAAKDRRKGLEDVLWALLNAKEFVLRR